jgi:hypothetical protein
MFEHGRAVPRQMLNKLDRAPLGPAEQLRQLSAPRMTILSASSGNGRCSAFASVDLASSLPVRSSHHLSNRCYASTDHSTSDTLKGRGRAVPPVRAQERNEHAAQPHGRLLKGVKLRTYPTLTPWLSQRRETSYEMGIK